MEAGYFNSKSGILKEMQLIVRAYKVNLESSTDPEEVIQSQTVKEEHHQGEKPVFSIIGLSEIYFSTFSKKNINGYLRKNSYERRGLKMHETPTPKSSPECSWKNLKKTYKKIEDITPSEVVHFKIFKDPFYQHTQ